MKIIGVDAATWSIIKPHRDELENFDELMRKCETDTLTVDEKPKSAPVWTSIFTGQSQAEHGHTDFIVDDELQTRQDIEPDFVWELLDSQGVETRVLQVPAVYPPINYHVEYDPVGYGVTADIEELEEDLEKLKDKTLDVLEEDPEFFAVVFMHLDKVSHFHWKEKETILNWYKKMDQVLGELMEYLDFESDEPIIILSDHGFADFGEGRVQTLPEKTPQGKLQGDHHEDAILMTNAVEFDIEDPEDVGKYVKNFYEMAGEST